MKARIPFIAISVLSLIVVSAFPLKVPSSEAQTKAVSSGNTSHELNFFLTQNDQMDRAEELKERQMEKVEREQEKELEERRRAQEKAEEKREEAAEKAEKRGKSRAEEMREKFGKGKDRGKGNGGPDKKGKYF